MDHGCTKLHEDEIAHILKIKQLLILLHCTVKLEKGGGPALEGPPAPGA